MATTPASAPLQTRCTDAALNITCKACHAPVGVPCVAIKWSAIDGRYLPTCDPRAQVHAIRRKLYQKHGGATKCV
jgi:hypothetical protein